MSIELEAAPQSAAKARLRLWLRMLRSTRLIESELRERLRLEFQATLPRFDVMAALYRQRDGMIMSDLSRFLMVSNGNVTGIIDRLVSDGLVSRQKREGDRRTSFVRLTSAGISAFEEMARSHEAWVSALLADFSGDEAAQLAGQLKNFESEWEARHE
ncbi:MAG: MarR family transcriptional regulator [Stappiaceae bacterium]